MRHPVPAPSTLASLITRASSWEERRAKITNRGGTGLLPSASTACLSSGNSPGGVLIVNEHEMGSWRLAWCCAWPWLSALGLPAGSVTSRQNWDRAGPSPDQCSAAASPSRTSSLWHLTSPASLGQNESGIFACTPGSSATAPRVSHSEPSENWALIPLTSSGRGALLERETTARVSWPSAIASAPLAVAR